MNRITKYTILLASIFAISCSFMYKDWTYRKMKHVLYFNNRISNKENECCISDTMSFLADIIPFYKSKNSEYSQFINNYGRETIKNTAGVDNSVSSWGIKGSEVFLYRKNYVLLFFIENEIINHSDTVWVIKNKKSGKIINGEINISKLNHPKTNKAVIRHYEWEEKQIAIIYGYYMNWLNKVEDLDIDYIRKNRIFPLDNSQYIWVPRKTHDGNLSKKSFE
jgi:hypothetical protein